MKKALKKLKRIELVELIYQLRKENIAQQKRCEELEIQLKKTEEQLQAYMNRADDNALERIEGMLAQLCKTTSRQEAGN